MTPLEALASLGDGEHTALEVAGRMGIAYNDRHAWKQVRQALVEAAERGECVKTRHASLGVRFMAAPRPSVETAPRGRPPVKRVKALRRMLDGAVPTRGLDPAMLKRLSEDGLCVKEGGFAEITDAGREYLEKWRSIA
jgi:hypothetical protein